MVRVPTFESGMYNQAAPQQARVVGSELTFEALNNGNREMASAAVELVNDRTNLQAANFMLEETEARSLHDTQLKESYQRDLDPATGKLRGRGISLSEAYKEDAALYDSEAVARAPTQRAREMYTQKAGEIRIRERLGLENYQNQEMRTYTVTKIGESIDRAANDLRQTAVPIRYDDFLKDGNNQISTLLDNYRGVLTENELHTLSTQLKNKLADAYIQNCQDNNYTEGYAKALGATQNFKNLGKQIVDGKTRRGTLDRVSQMTGKEIAYHGGQAFIPSDEKSFNAVMNDYDRQVSNIKVNGLSGRVFYVPKSMEPTEAMSLMEKYKDYYRPELGIFALSEVDEVTGSMSAELNYANTILRKISSVQENTDDQGITHITSGSDEIAASFLPSRQATSPLEVQEEDIDEANAFARELPPAKFDQYLRGYGAMMSSKSTVTNESITIRTNGAYRSLLSVDPTIRRDLTDIEMRREMAVLVQDMDMLVASGKLSPIERNANIIKLASAATIGNNLKSGAYTQNNVDDLNYALVNPDRTFLSIGGITPEEYKSMVHGYEQAEFNTKLQTSLNTEIKALNDRINVDHDGAGLNRDIQMTVTGSNSLMVSANKAYAANLERGEDGAPVLSQLQRRENVSKNIIAPIDKLAEENNRLYGIPIPNQWDKQYVTKAERQMVTTPLNAMLTNGARPEQVIMAIDQYSNKHEQLFPDIVDIGIKTGELPKHASILPTLANVSANSQDYKQYHLMDWGNTVANYNSIKANGKAVLRNTVNPNARVSGTSEARYTSVDGLSLAVRDYALSSGSGFGTYYTDSADSRNGSEYLNSMIDLATTKTLLDISKQEGRLKSPLDKEDIDALIKTNMDELVSMSSVSIKKKENFNNVVIPKYMFGSKENVEKATTAFEAFTSDPELSFDFFAIKEVPPFFADRYPGDNAFQAFKQDAINGNLGPMKIHTNSNNTFQLGVVQGGTFLPFLSSVDPATGKPEDLDANNFFPRWKDTVDRDLAKYREEYRKKLITKEYTTTHTINSSEMRQLIERIDSYDIDKNMRNQIILEEITLKARTKKEGYDAYREYLNQYGAHTIYGFSGGE